MEACCQCKLTRFTIPHDKPTSLVVCHCNRCKLMTGSAYYVVVPFPWFEFPPAEAKTTLSTITEVADSGNVLTGWFCKGCGNRMVYTAGDGGKEWVSVGATKIVGFDWGMVKDKEVTSHLWTEHAVVDVPEGFKAWKRQPVFQGWEGRPVFVEEKSGD